MSLKYIFVVTSMFFVAGVVHAATETALLSKRTSTAEQVQFLIGGKLYAGHLDVDVHECLLANIVAADDHVEADEHYDGLLEVVRGYRVPGHQDIGLEIYLLGDRGEIAFRYGIIEEVYDNGYHKIGVYSETYHNGETIHLFKPDYLIIHKAVLLQDGGFGIIK